MIKIHLIALTFVTLMLSCDQKYPDLEDGMYANLETNKGDIMLQLAVEKTPITVANFVSLAEGNNPLVDDQFSGKNTMMVSSFTG